MNRLIKHISILVGVVITLTLAGCKGKSATGVIPADANLVVSLDMMKIAEEGDLLNSPLFDQASRILQINPLEMGIDFTEPLYFFELGDGTIGVAANIFSKDKIDDCLEGYAKKNIAQKPKEKDGLTWSKLFGEIDLAYDDNTLLFISDLNGNNASAKDIIKGLFSLEENQTFFATDQFKRMTEYSRSDIAFFSNLAAVPENNRSIFTTILPENVRLNDVKLVASLDCEDGEMICKENIYSDNPEVQKMIDEQEKSIQKIECTYLDKIPKDAIGVLMAGVHGKELYQQIKSQPKLSRYLTLAGFGTSLDIDKLITDAEGDVMLCGKGEDIDKITLWSNNQTTQIVSDDEPFSTETKTLPWSESELKDYCFVLLIDFTQYNSKLAKQVPIPSIYDLLNDLEYLAVTSKGEGDLTFILHSTNNENIFKQLFH